MAEKYLLSPAQLWAEKTANPNLKIIDTGLPDPFQKCHIPGAVNITDFYLFMLKDSSAKTLKEMQNHFAEILGAAGISRTDRIVVYEESMDLRNGAGPRGLFVLNYLGADNVAVLHGGLDAWKAEGLPTQEGPADTAEKVEFMPVINDSVMATRSDIIIALSNKNEGLLDDRDKEEWIGEIPCIDFPILELSCPRKGRIPRANWVLWRDLMETAENGVMQYKSGKEIGEICSSKGFTDKNQPIIIYCFAGMRASNTWLALKLAGYSNVRNYFGSWNEWSRDPALPIDGTLLKLNDLDLLGRSQEKTPVSIQAPRGSTITSE